MTEKKYLVAVCVFNYFGSARVRLLYSFFKTAKKIWESSTTDLLKTGLRQDKVAEFDNFRKVFDIESYFKNLSSQKIEVTTFIDLDFPKMFKELPGAPAVLYYRGSLKGLKNNCVAIVGARKMTSYGREVTEKFSGGLGTLGITVISGLARGVDTAAHKACLSVGGTTVAVLAGGLDNIYPPENKTLAEEIIKKGGAIVSEYPLGVPALPVNFAVRNRIVSGLANCVLVVEGEERSGTFLTANHAAEQGKTVFAVPGQITSPLSKAPLYLLKNGAKMATDIKDILEEMDMDLKVDKEKMESISPNTPEDAEITKLLENEALYLDELVRITGSKTPEISARLTIMEMKGLIKNLGGGKYQKCN